MTLYSADLLALARGPHPPVPPGATHVARGDNPTCGDAIEVGVVVDDARVVLLGFHGEACAVCLASATAMAALAHGMRRSDIVSIGDAFATLVTRGQATVPPSLRLFGTLARHPVRASCATLPWRALTAALAGAPP